MPKQPQNTAQLKVGGQLYGGWQTLRVQRGLEQLAGIFTVTVTERWADQDTLRPILRGSTCQVLLNNQPVITGYIDSIEPEYDAQKHSLTVTGRDKTGDLVDCSFAEGVSPQINGLRLDQLAARVIKPFGIGLILSASVGGPFPSVIQEIPGQTPFEFLTYLARFRGVILTSDALGNLVITTPGSTIAPTRLMLGKNILTGRGRSDMSQVFSSYTVYSQEAMSGQQIPGLAYVGPIAMATDKTVGRFRPTSIGLSDGMVSGNGPLQQRANYERAVRAARAVKVTHTVNGWEHAQGLWLPNTLVSVEDSYMNLNEQRLISEVAYLLDEQGARTEITTVGKHGYDAMHEPEAILAFGGTG